MCIRDRLQHAARMAEENAMRITLAHISTDYRALNYVSDSLLNDDVSQDCLLYTSGSQSFNLD